VAANDGGPFRATFTETFTSLGCSSDTRCEAAVTGHGSATKLGATTEFLVGVVDFSGETPANPCHILTDARILLAANGDQLFVNGIGKGCDDPNKPIEHVSLTWKVTGGTGRFRHASGHGTETGVGHHDTGIVDVEYQGVLSLSGEDN
jgi:hypothetical protein